MIPSSRSCRSNRRSASLSRLELLSDTIRGHLVGSGFQEIMSNILCSREELEDSLQPDEQLVEVDNVMSLAYSVLRHRVIPSLLNVEAVSSKAFYPHRIFEAGEVAVFDQSAIMGSRTDLNLAALISHPGANFSEMHSSLDILLYYLGLEYKLEPSDHALFHSRPLRKNHCRLTPNSALSARSVLKCSSAARSPCPARLLRSR